MIEVAQLWIEVNNLWQEIYDIWGSDGKITAHDITEIWKKLKDIESKIGSSSSGGGGGGGTVGGPGIIDIFVMNPNHAKEFYIHFTNGFKMLCLWCDFQPGSTWQSDAGTMLGQETNIVRSWMTGFSGFTAYNTYMTFPASDEAGTTAHPVPGNGLINGHPSCPNVQVSSFDQCCLWYSRGYTATSIIWSSTGLETDSGSGYIKAYPLYHGMYVFCIGY